MTVWFWSIDSFCELSFIRTAGAGLSIFCTNSIFNTNSTPIQHIQQIQYFKHRSNAFNIQSTHDSKRLNRDKKTSNSIENRFIIKSCSGINNAVFSFYRNLLGIYLIQHNRQNNATTDVVSKLALHTYISAPLPNPKP